MAFGDAIVQEALTLGLGEPETDGKRWVLDASPASDLVMLSNGRIMSVPKEPVLAKDKPEFEEMVGSYMDVSRRAFFLNNRQRQSGFLAWIFYPHPVAK